MAYAEFLAPLIGSWLVYRAWLWSDKHHSNDDPRNRHRPL
jgi:hypothetical protein